MGTTIGPGAKGAPRACRGRVRGRARSALAVVVGLGSTACGSGRTPLVVYSSESPELLSYFEDAFEANHPGVDVRTVEVSAGKALERLRAERKRPQADVWWGGPAALFREASADSLLTPYRPAWADAVAACAPDSLDRWHTLYRMPVVIAVNSDSVPLSLEPRDWRDLFHPRWADRILLRDPIASGTMRTLFGALIYRELRRTGDEQAGFDWLLRLDASTQQYLPSRKTLLGGLARGFGVVTIWNLPDLELARGLRHAPLHVVLPETGAPVAEDAIAVVGGTPELTLAQAFVDFVGTRDAVRTAAARFYRMPARGDLREDELPEWIASVRTRMRVWELDREFVDRHIDGWMRRWDAEVRGRGKLLY